MKLIETVRGIRGSNVEEYDDGLPNKVSSTSIIPLNNNHPNFMIQSIFGGYQEEGNKVDSEYYEDTENTPGISDGAKTETKDDIMTEIVKPDARSQLFRDMESGEQNQDNHLSTLTAHFNVGTRALRETDPPVQMTEPSPDSDS